MHFSPLLVEQSSFALPNLPVAADAIKLSMRHGIRTKEQSYAGKGGV